MADLKKEDKPVFGLTMDHSGAYVMLVGIPDAAWEYCKDGKTLTFDMAAAGAPIKLIMFGGQDQKTCKKLIETHNQRQGVSSLDVTGKRHEDSFQIKDGGQSASTLKGRVFR